VRLLILAVLIYLAWRAVKSWMASNSLGRRAEGDLQAGQVDDLMEKDPFCGVYFPKREGVRLQRDGKDLYFCSEECRDRYLEGEEKDNS